MSNCGVFLPEELVPEILIRLPVKSIGISRCLSKQWNSLLTSPRFINTHYAFHTSSHHPSFSQKKMLFRHYSSLFTCSLSPDVIVDSDFRKLNSIPRVDWESRLVGPCNGLVLIVLSESCKLLMNPTTLQHSRLPESPDSSLGIPFGYGLGYDHSSSDDDYKVVSIYGRLCGDSHKYYNIFADIYSVKMQSWSRTDCYGSVYNGFDDGVTVFVNGALHWIAFRENISAKVICALDLGTEKFYEIPLLESLSRPPKQERLVATIATKGCLGIVIMDFEQSRFDVWVMKKYGMVESWTKTISYEEAWSFSSTCVLTSSSVDKYMTCYTFDDEKSYDFSDHMRNNISKRCISDGHGLILSESLVSPHHYNTQ